MHSERVEDTHIECTNYRPVIILIAFWLVAASMLADDSLPIVEVKADRTMIYPQRKDLTGEESRVDALQGRSWHFISTFVPNKASFCVKMLHKPKKVCTFLAKDLHNSKKSSNFAADFGV